MSFTLKNFDPGFVQMRKATKSTLAVMLTLVIVFSWAPRIGGLFACLSAMFILLCTDGVALRERVTSMMIATAGFVMTLTLGWLLCPYPVWATLVLLLLTFMAFYVRRFGVRYFLFPPVATVIYLLAISFPLANVEEGLLASLAMLSGGAVAILVFLGLWRDQLPVLSIRHQMLRIFERYTMMFTLLTQTVATQADHQVYLRLEEQFVRQEQDLTDLAGQISQLTPRYYRRQWLNDFWVKQFAFEKALTMVWESLTQLRKASDKIVLHREIIVDQLRYIQAELNNISASYLNKQLCCPMDGQSTHRHKHYGLSCQDKKCTIHLLNLTFALNRCEELLQLCRKMLNDEQRWQEGKMPK